MYCSGYNLWPGRGTALKRMANFRRRAREEREGAGSRQQAPTQKELLRLILHWLVF